MADPRLREALQAAFGIRIEKMSRVRGGDIAEAYLLQTPSRRLFLKLLADPDGLKMLQAEADGLLAIEATGAVRVPEIIAAAPLDAGGALLLEYIPPGEAGAPAFESLGEGLARLHLSGSARFGWRRPNYIGPLPQINTPETDWPLFFARHRLMPQYQRALGLGMLKAAEVPALEVLAGRIADLVPRVSPSLLHGDLWGGNYLISEEGIPCLIDPAVYYGHSEVDLAMSLLFGGFPSGFYDAYFQVIPREPGFEERVALYQLYYLLVHLNLFGRSYYPRVSQISARLFRR